MNKKFNSNWNGEKTLSIDGTGVLPSVTNEEATKIYNYILKEYGEIKSILDIGAGRGLLQKTIEEISDCKVWSIEGYGSMPFEANKERLIVADATIPFTNEYEKAFDLVTSFECIEHIHQSGQEAFWKNVFYASNNALVGIHVLNGEGPEHCFIRNKEWWFNFFESNGIQFKLLGEPTNVWSVWPKADCSLFFKLKKV